jgi:ribosome-associated protein
MEDVKDKVLNRETATVEITPSATTPFEELDEPVKLALTCASDKKAFDIVALDLREIASFTEFFLMVSGANQRQVQAVADEIEERLKKECRAKPVRIEGYSSADWVLMDYGDFVVHIFDRDARSFYDLERLWRDARRVTLPTELSSSSDPGSQ